MEYENFKPEVEKVHKRLLSLLIVEMAICSGEAIKARDNLNTGGIINDTEYHEQVIAPLRYLGIDTLLKLEEFEKFIKVKYLPGLQPFEYGKYLTYENPHVEASIIIINYLKEIFIAEEQPIPPLLAVNRNEGFTISKFANVVGDTVVHPEDAWEELRTLLVKKLTNKHIIQILLNKGFEFEYLQLDPPPNTMEKVKPTNIQGIPDGTLFIQHY